MCPLIHRADSVCIHTFTHRVGLQLHRALCCLFRPDTDGTRVSKCGQLSQQTRRLDPMLFQCWSGAVGGGPILKQHWVKCSRLLGSTQVSVYTHPSATIIFSPADPGTFNKTAGQSQSYYNTWNWERGTYDVNHLHIWPCEGAVSRVSSVAYNMCTFVHRAESVCTHTFTHKVQFVSTRLMGEFACTYTFTYMMQHVYTRPQGRICAYSYLHMQSAICVHSSTGQNLNVHIGAHLPTHDVICVQHVYTYLHTKGVSTCPQARLCVYTYLHTQGAICVHSSTWQNLRVHIPSHTRCNLCPLVHRPDYVCTHTFTHKVQSVYTRPHGRICVYTYIHTKGEICVPSSTGQNLCVHIHSHTRWNLCPLIHRAESVCTHIFTHKVQSVSTRPQGRICVYTYIHTQGAICVHSSTWCQVSSYCCLYLQYQAENW